MEGGLIHLTGKKQREGLFENITRVMLWISSGSSANNAPKTCTRPTMLAAR